MWIQSHVCKQWLQLFFRAFFSQEILVQSPHISETWSDSWMHISWILISRVQKLLTSCPVTPLITSFRHFPRINTFIFTTASEVRKNYCKNGQHKLQQFWCNSIWMPGEKNHWPLVFKWHFYILTTTFTEIGSASQHAYLLSQAGSPKRID